MGIIPPPDYTKTPFALGLDLDKLKKVFEEFGFEKV